MNIDNYKFFLFRELPIMLSLTLIITILFSVYIKRPLVKWSWMAWIFLINIINAINNIKDARGIIKTTAEIISKRQNYLTYSLLYLIISAILGFTFFILAFLAWRKEIRNNKRIKIIWPLSIIITSIFAWLIARYLLIIILFISFFSHRY